MSAVREKKTAALGFRAVCLSAAALLFVLGLLTDVQSTAARAEAQRYEAMAEELRSENARLEARLESELSLEELERRATEELGMQKCRPEQIIHIDLPEQEG